MPRIKKTTKLFEFSPDLIKEGQVVFVRNFGIEDESSYYHRYDNYKDFYKAVIVRVGSVDDFVWDFVVEFENTTIDTKSCEGSLRWYCGSAEMQEEDFMFEVLR